LEKQRRYSKKPETPNWKPLHIEFLASCFEMETLLEELGCFNFQHGKPKRVFSH
jgi:hypothetical protein